MPEQPVTDLLLISTLAAYQTDFWIEVARELKALGHAVAFLSFDDRSTEALGDAGFEVFSPMGAATAPVAGRADILEVARAFGLDNLNFWVSHERIAFGLRDSEAIQRRLVDYLRMTDAALETLERKGYRVRVVQELGGFISVVAGYAAARRRGIENWFLEPAFFRGRLFFLKNTFSALKVQPGADGQVLPQVQAYLDRTVSEQRIVVPQKDRHHYNSAVKKVMNGRNFVRLFQKLADKHLKGKHQEFGHIGHHVRVHARMVINGLKLQGNYDPLEKVGPFVYFPFHVPADVALTFRAPELLDQLALVDYLCRVVPPTHRVVVKEHPAMIGALDAPRLISLLKKYDNLSILAPSTNNYSVLRAADAVVTINSKSGAEAMLLGRRAIVLGDAFYANAPLATKVAHLADLPETLEKMLSEPSRPAGDDLAAYFTSAWKVSHPGELYVTDPVNVQTFTGSLLAALEERGESLCTPSRA